MSEQQLISNDAFWKFLVSLEGLKERKDKVLFCATLSIDEETLQRFVTFLSRFDVLFESDDEYIYPLKEQYRIKMEFSLSEWLAFQANLGTEEALTQFKHYYQKIVQNKMISLKQANEQFNLYKKPTGPVAQSHEFENLKKKVDYDINHKRSVKIHFFNGKECNLFPHRLVFLEGVLCVIGESVADKVLLYFGLEDIESVEAFQIDYYPNFSQIEVNEFICHLRVIGGKEERLILKVYNQYEADLMPNHHFLGNPFVTTNGEGDMIWAATIEMCDDLFKWLYTMKDRAEVLDPGHVKLEFAQYCEIKKETSGVKKAS